MELTFQDSLSVHIPKKFLSKYNSSLVSRTNVHYRWVHYVGVKLRGKDRVIEVSIRDLDLRDHFITVFGNGFRREIPLVRFCTQSKKGD